MVPARDAGLDGCAPKHATAVLSAGDCRSEVRGPCGAQAPSTRRRKSAGFLTAALIATILNALGSERPTYVCEYNRGCEPGGFAMGEAMDWQTPRRYEAGFRLEF